MVQLQSSTITFPQSFLHYFFIPSQGHPILFQGLIRFPLFSAVHYPQQVHFIDVFSIPPNLFFHVNVVSLTTSQDLSYLQPLTLPHSPPSSLSSHHTPFHPFVQFPYPILVRFLFIHYPYPKLIYQISKKSSPNE